MNKNLLSQVSSYEIKGSLHYKSIFRQEVALDVQLMNFII